MGPYKNLGKEQTNSDNPLYHFFIEQEKEATFPYLLAIGHLEEVEKDVQTDQHLIQKLAREIIFASIYATFYEELMVTIKENPNHALELIDSFSAGSSQREAIIEQLTENHLNYLLAAGHCSGCVSCPDHKDVDDLIAPLTKKDTHFFMTLFLGMSAIQFTMEHILYDVTPHDLTILDDFNKDNILQLRQEIIAYGENKLASDI